MVEIVREFVVREEVRGQFELAYGPGGAWSRLFARAPGFRGTTLLRDVENPRRYVVLDLWETRSQREQALTDHQTEYADLEALLMGWSESTAELGVFSVRAEATVRPVSRPGPSGHHPGQAPSARLRDDRPRL